MEIVKGAMKKLTGKRFIIKNNGLCGKVIKSSDYLIRVKLDNGTTKTYTRPEFERVAEVIIPKVERVKRPKVDEVDFEERCLASVAKYIRTHYRHSDVVLNFISKHKISVLLNGVNCGLMTLDDTGLKVRFKQHIPPPNLNKYKIKTNRDFHTYLFTDLQKDTINDMNIAINWLLLTGKERV